MWRSTSLVIGFIMLVGLDHAYETTRVAAQTLPAAWQADWDAPAAGHRPLQIVHGIPPSRASVEGMQYYHDLGLGGIVCNAAFDEYLRSETHWQTLVKGVEACHQLGLIVWLYDEKGYPSGAAGGLVLAHDPRFEAVELTYDPTANEPFEIRAAYEHTHASNNYHAARRYPNLIDDRATACFIQLTHDAYWQRLEPHFGSTIQATFTDEPSLMAVDLGQIPEPARSRVPVVDPIDPGVKPLASVPWSYDLPARYRERYGQDLIPHRRSLFTGETEADRRVRRQFWQLISGLIADRYFGAIQSWCRAHRVAASGHTLHEESILHQVPLEGNALRALMRMEIPGLDMLSSDPQTVVHSGWLTAALPSSAAQLSGGRRVMTEISDFSQKMSGHGPATLTDMQAAAAWQAAWGVTDFTLYYRPEDRPPDAYRAYGDYVGRLNAILRTARFDRRVLLYYPIYDLWADYLPVAGPLRLDSQSVPVQQIVHSFLRLGRALQRSQIPFVLVDHDLLAEAEVRADGRLRIGRDEFDSLVLPFGVELPPPVAAMVQRCEQAGGRVVRGTASDSENAKTDLLADLQPAVRISPAADSIALGAFSRDGRQILVLANVGRDAYAGSLRGLPPSAWMRLDPSTAHIERITPDTDGQHVLRLSPGQCLLLVGSSRSPPQDPRPHRRSPSVAWARPTRACASEIVISTALLWHF